MKKLILVLVAISALILVGCQDNKEANPVSYKTLNKTQPIHNEVTRGKISLDKILVDPGLGNNYYQVKGKIDFTDEYLKIKHNLKDNELSKKCSKLFILDYNITYSRVEEFRKS